MRTLMAALIATSALISVPAAMAASDTTSPALSRPAAKHVSARDKVKGNWTQAKGHVKEQWGKLTDNDLTEIRGRREQLVGKIQARYGVDATEAEKQVASFESTYKPMKKTTAAAKPSTWDKVEGNWTEMKGHVKEQWGKLTDDDLTEIQGHREQLVGKIQKRYGVSLAEANKQVNTFEKKVVR